MNPIVLEGLTVRYGDRLALDEVSLAVAERAVYALLGRNGAGKSSLVRCLLGEQEPAAGRVSLLGRDVWAERAAILKDVGVVPEDPDMPPALRIDPRDARPIWRQIEEGVQHLVARGALPSGTAVPSVRDLAKDLQVNPATVFKAYQRLTDAGVLTVRRGEGTFVAASPPAASDAQRIDRLREEAVRYASLAVTLGASREETVATLEAAWRSLKDGNGKAEGDEK